MTDHPEFGKLWAARGEKRPLRFRTPLAWVQGFDGGVLFVRFGDDRPDRLHVMMMSDWLMWVKAEGAVPVPDPEPAFEIDRP